METKRKNDKVVITMPAYNAEHTLKQVYSAVPKKWVDLILLIDDGSKDKTIQVARKLKIKTIVHKKNMGYGANQKTCYKNALKMGADYVIMLHPDGQYDPRDIPKFVKQLKRGYGLVLGSRFLARGHQNTPLYKSISIRVITQLFNLVLGIKISEANTGYRGFSRKLLETIPFHKNGAGYIFDPQAIIQAKHFGFRIGEVPTTKDYNEGASSPNFKKSLDHGFENINLLVQYTLHRLGLKKANFLIH